MVEELYPLYFDELVRFLSGLLGGRAAAEDAAQETFLRALGHADQLAEMDGPACRAWLYRTAKRICIDPPHEQALFVMNVFEGYAARDLDELFDLRPDAVRQRLCSARARLRRWYAETEGWRERT